MSAPVAMNEVMTNKLRTHFAQCERKLIPIDIGSLTQLQVIVKIIDSEEISRAIRVGGVNYYPDLPERQYLIACVRERSDVVRVWGMYNAEHIRQMEAMHTAQNIEWKILEISNELEAKLRTNTVVRGYEKPQQSNRSCVML